MNNSQAIQARTTDMDNSQSIHAHMDNSSAIPASTQLAKDPTEFSFDEDDEDVADQDVAGQLGFLNLE